MIDGAVLATLPAHEPVQRLVIGIGEYAIAQSTAQIVTHALGSCIAVCLWDPQAQVGAMLHFLLPEAKVNPERAKRQPACFADTGIPLLVEAAVRGGLNRKRCRAFLVGGGSVGAGGGMDVGKRNTLAARRLLWQQGLFVHKESIGGTAARTVIFSVADGHIQVTSGRELLEELS
jgi:chemotaxis protein CheD